MIYLLDQERRYLPDFVSARQQILNKLFSAVIAFYREREMLYMMFYIFDIDILFASS